MEMRSTTLHSHSIDNCKFYFESSSSSTHNLQVVTGDSKSQIRINYAALQSSNDYRCKDASSRRSAYRNRHRRCRLSVTALCRIEAPAHHNQKTHKRQTDPRERTGLPSQTRTKDAKSRIESRNASSVRETKPSGEIDHADENHRREGP